MDERGRVSLSYPVLDLALAAVLARAVLTGGKRPPTFWLLCGFVTSLLATDFAYTLALIQGTWTPGSTLALGWIGEPAIGRLLLFDALTARLDEVKVRRDPDCPVCGEHPTITKYIDYVEFCAAR